MKGKQVSDKVSVALTGWLDNSLSDEQAVELVRWIGEDSNNLVALMEAEKLWNASALLARKEPDVAPAWNRVLDKIEMDDVRKLPGRQVIIKLSVLMKVAAVFLGMVLIAGVLLLRNPDGDVSDNYFKAEAPRGSRSVITLPDGSMIWLNSGTTLRYNPDFGVRSREIQLEGEAYFSVAENRKIPFRVLTTELCITALGTSFNVKAYPEEVSVETTLETGEVKIEQITVDRTKVSEALILSPKQKAVFIRSSGLLSKDYSEDKAQPGINKTPVTPALKVAVKVDTMPDTRLATSWKDSRWMFRSEKLHRLVPILERRYDITIVFSDTVLRNYTFTGTIKEDNLEQVLMALTSAAPINYKIDHKIVILSEDLERKRIFDFHLQPD